MCLLFFPTAIGVKRGHVTITNTPRPVLPTLSYRRAVNRVILSAAIAESNPEGVSSGYREDRI